MSRWRGFTRAEFEVQVIAVVTWMVLVGLCVFWGVAQGARWFPIGVLAVLYSVWPNAGMAIPGFFECTFLPAISA